MIGVVCVYDVYIVDITICLSGINLMLTELLDGILVTHVEVVCLGVYTLPISKPRREDRTSMESLDQLIVARASFA